MNKLIVVNRINRFFVLFLLLSHILFLNLFSQSSLELNHSELKSFTSTKKIYNTAAVTGTYCNETVKDAYVDIQLSLADYFNAINIGGTTAFSVKVKVDIVGYTNLFVPLSSGSISSINLELNENTPTHLYRHNFLSNHSNISYFEISISSYSCSSISKIEDAVNLSINVNTDFKIKAYETTTATIYNTKLITASTPTTNTDGTIHLSWIPTCNFPMYQIQVLRLRNNSAANVNIGAVEKKQNVKVDWNNALTFETTETALDFLPTEGQAWYFYRVRPIGNYYDNDVADSRNWGQWSSASSQGSSVSLSATYNKSWSFFYTDPQLEYNYSVSRNFSEDNKQSEALSYYNGLLMPKQSQIKSVSDEKIIVNQNLYDYTGRNLFSPLALPVDKTYFEYYDNLLLYNNGITNELYTAEYFDGDNVNNPKEVSGPLADYYSNQNSDLTIPSADGYPFSRIIQDAQARVKEISGIGSDLKIGSNHTSKIYYSSATDDELRFVLGDEALNYKSVVKVITVDPNGLTMVEFRDKAGNVIISNLMSNSSSNGFEALSNKSSHTFSTTITENQAWNDYAVRSNFSFSVAQPTTVYVDYKLNVDEVNSCINYCSSCDYVVTISVYNTEDPNDVYTPTTYTIPADACVGGSTYEPLPPTTEFAVGPGSYMIQKIVTTNTIVSSSQTSENPLGTTYLNDHLYKVNGVQDVSETELATLIDPINAILEVNDYKALYAYLDTQITLNPDVYSKTLTTTGDTDYYSLSTSCCNIDIPYLQCDEYTCPDMSLPYSAAAYDEFITYFLETMLAVAKEEQLSYETTDIKWNYYDELIALIEMTSFSPDISIVSDFSNTNLNMLMYNMMHDPNVSAILDDTKYYSCEKIWSCWASTAQTAASQYVYALLNGTSYDAVEIFLNCVGFHYIGFVPTSKTTSTATNPSWTSPTSYTGGWKTHRYALFPYDYVASSPTTCDAWFNDYCTTNYAKSWPSGMMDADYVDCGSNPLCDTYENRPWEKYYQCINGESDGTQTPRYYEKSLENACYESCENRRYEFTSEATEILTEKYGEGGFTDSDLDCIIEMLISYCNSHCNLSIQYGGSGSASYSSALSYTSTSSPSSGYYYFNITEGKIYRLLIVNPSLTGGLIYHNNDCYGTNLYNGDDFYAQSTICTLFVAPSWVYGTDFYLAQDNSVYNGIATSNEMEKLTKALTYVASVSLPDALGNCLSGEELVDEAVSSIGINIISNGDFSTYSTTSSSCASLPCDVTSCATNWKVTHGLPQVYEVTDNDQQPRAVYLNTDWSDTEVSGTGRVSGSGIAYTIPLSVSTSSSYTLKFDIKLDDVKSTRLDNFYAVLLSSIPSSTYAPNPATLEGVVLKHVFDFDHANWETFSVTFTPTSTTYKYLMLYPYQNNGNTTESAVWLDNIEFGLTSMPTCEKVCFNWLNPLAIFTEEVSEYYIPSCQENIADYLSNHIQAQQQNCIVNTNNEFQENYLSTCAAPENINDEMTIYYDLGSYQYTLAYCDLSGRLIKTVPPAGVDESNTSYSQSYHPAHQLASTNYYNSLSQLTRKETPDGGIVEFWYNAMGLLRYSQNAQQKIENTFNYLKYDDLGRFIESGTAYLPTSSTTSILETNVDVSSYPSYGTEYEKSFTVYTQEASSISKEQHFLQNRISYVYNDEDGNLTTTSDQAYTYYSYDALGNVEWIMPQIPDLGTAFIEYEYDIITSSISKIIYNKGYEDQYFIQYEYDENKRLVAVYTSFDDVLWEKDAAYEYYAHGPLKRTQIGNELIQGIDYTYTIQGYLKGINHPELSSSSDPCFDGATSSNVAKDIFGSSLHYYSGDFDRSYSGTNSAFNTTHSTYISPVYNFYNGTIAAIASQIGKRVGTLQNEALTAEKYSYDELKRLLKSTFFTHTASAYTSSTNYASNTSYDENGNITKIRRTAYNTGSSNSLDYLTFKYKDLNADGVIDNNQLQYITDAVAPSSFNDIDNQTSTSNYEYDALGQLIKDKAESIDAIKWNAKHKVKEVIQSGTDDNLIILYDASGNRIVKKAQAKSGSISNHFYVRDASGDILARYKNDGSALTLQEIPIKGMNRIGNIMPSKTLTAFGTAITLTNYYSRNIGNKQYELSDHLGNVRAVISDKKIYNSLAAENALEAEVLSYSNYYPYGMEQPGRYWQSSDYNYGYNGMEKDNELKGEGNSYDFGARILDPRIGRWLSMDPLAEKFISKSPYNAMGNDPINRIDPDGKLDASVAAVYLWGIYKQDGSTVTTGLEALTFTDVDDVSVLMNGIHTNGDEAGYLDYGLAAAGTFIPFVAGGVVLKVFRKSSSEDGLSLLAKLEDDGLHDPTKSNGSIFLSKAGDKLFARATQLKPLPGVYDVIAHGSETFIVNGKGVKLSPHDLAVYIENDPDYLRQTVRLISCNTGKCINGFAQQLADELGVSVLAPNGFARLTPFNTVDVVSLDKNGKIVKRSTDSYLSFSSRNPSLPRKKEVVFDE